METSAETSVGGYTGSPSYEASDSTFPGSSSPFHHDLENIELSDVMFYVFLYKIVVPVLFCLIMIIGLIGNCLVIAVTVTQRKMHNTVNLLLLNLAFSDLAFLVLCVPFMTYHYAAENWLIGDAACKVMQFTVYATVYVTVYTLVCISVLRFQRVVCSSRGPSRQPRLRIVVVLVIVIWTVMLTVNSPILVISRVKTYENKPGKPYYYCGMDEHQHHGRRLFLSFFVLTYLLPLTTISTMYFLILRYLNARKTCHQTVSESASKRTSHASRISTAIIVVFGLCWLPLHVNLLVVNYGTQPQTRFYQVARVLCHVAAYANACINPLVYHYVSVDFRQSLRSFCAFEWCRKRLRRRKTDFWPRDVVLKEWTHPGNTGNNN